MNDEHKLEVIFKISMDILSAFTSVGDMAPEMTLQEASDVLSDALMILTSKV